MNNFVSKSPRPVWHQFPVLLLTACVLAPTFSGVAHAQPNSPSLTIDLKSAIAPVSPMHYGLMTEEINHSYDGGLYAELVQNRAFLDNGQNPVHWSVVQSEGSKATMALDKSQPLTEALPVALRVEVANASRTAMAGAANDGYWGIPVKPQTSYRASFYAKAAPNFSGPLTISIQSNDGKTIYAQQSVKRLTADWKQYQLTLKTGKVVPTTQARLVIATDRPGTFWLNLVSLFPPTFKNRPNGLRPDLMQMMADMKPKFLRFPGGNYLEGNTIAERFEWKKTIGPLENRPGHPAPWGYRSSDGMGLMEFLLWCEDIGAEPLLGIYAGYSLRGDYIKPGPDLVPYIQDALDEIEYITGPITTKWGAERAKNGHPKPFPLTYAEIGNEDWFDKSGSYDGRFAQFYDAIKAKYPQLKLISSVGFEQPKSKWVTSRKPDVVDEHYYRSADEFFRMEPNQYERYLRQAPEIFVGEWAAYEDIVPWDAKSRNLPPTPSMKSALGDAAFMAAMERNSDLVTMQCYAPMFVNVNPGGRQWRPNLIGYDALRAYGSPSYHAIQMFGSKVGDRILSATLNGVQMPVSVTQDSKSGTIFVKLVNRQNTPQTLRLDLNGARSVASSGIATILAADPLATNSMDELTEVIPVTRPISGVGPTFTQILEPNSITVLQLKAAVAPLGSRPASNVNPQNAPNVMPAMNTNSAPPTVAPTTIQNTDNVAPLKEAFKGKFLIGTVLGGQDLRGQGGGRLGIATRHFNAFTTENEMKPDAVQPREGQFNFAAGDRLVEIAEQNGATPVGHTLIWHSQTPRWFFEGPDGQPVSRELALARMRKHIATVVGHFKGRIKQWDVVNEAINDGPGILRPSPWQKAIGDDYIAEAFRAAHEADPDAILTYNDYNNELPNKREKTLQMLKSLIDQKVPINAVGMQCHWRMDSPNLADVEESIKQYSALGLKVMITEFDIGVLPTPRRLQGADVNTRENMTPEQRALLNPYANGLPDDVAQKLAERYRQAFEMFLRHKDVIGRVTLWGVDDGSSWLNSYPIGGRTDHPLLFDRQSKPKPAFFAVQKAAANDGIQPEINVAPAAAPANLQNRAPNRATGNQSRPRRQSGLSARACRFRCQARRYSAWRD